MYMGLLKPRVPVLLLLLQHVQTSAVMIGFPWVTSNNHLGVIRFCLSVAIGSDYSSDRGRQQRAIGKSGLTIPVT